MMFVGSIYITLLGLVIASLQFMKVFDHLITILLYLLFYVCAHHHLQFEVAKFELRMLSDNNYDIVHYSNFYFTSPIVAH